MQITVDSGVDTHRVKESINRLLRSELTGALATEKDGAPLACTIYFAYGQGYVWFTSQEVTRHVAALRLNPSVALSIWHRPEVWGSHLLGLQLSCKASEVTNEDVARSGLGTLHIRFPGTKQTLPDVA